MATIDYIPNSTGGGALVMSQPNYISAAPNGVVNGLADPTFMNKTVRQSSMFAAALANIISTSLGGINVLDDGNLSALITNLTSAIQAVASGGPSVGFGPPLNLRLGASVGSNQLTVSVLGTNGAAPSGSNPVTIPFRNATIATGDGAAVQLASALTFTVASGSTMGVAANNQPFRLWAVAFNNAGAVCLALINCSIAGQIFALNEDALQSSQAGTSGGSTAGLYYANVSGLGSLPIRILGYLEWASGLPTAGVWSAGPTKIQLFGPGQSKPGGTVQSIGIASNTLNITPTSPVNQVKVSAKKSTSVTTGASGSSTLLRGATTLDTQSISNGGAGTNVYPCSHGPFLDNPYASGATTYSTAAAGVTPSQNYIMAEEIMA
jgi:hypothetical protein